MGWIRPDITKNFINIELSNMLSLSQILERSPKECSKDTSFELNFDEVYTNSVYTSWNSILGLLKYIKYYDINIDLVLLTGHAGNGHRAPTRAIAKKTVQKSDSNIVIIDLLSLLSSSIAKINDKAWVTLSRSEFGQEFWNKFVRGEVDPEKNANDISALFKLLYTKKVKKLMNKLSPKVMISTYPYTNAIISKIADDTSSVEFAGVVVTDTEMLGFAMSSYGDVSNLHYFVASEESWENGIKIYPYLKDAKEPIFIGTNPCFFDKEAEGKIVPDTVLFIPGSAEGLGIGIRALPSIAELCRKTQKKLICVSGLGIPYKYARKIHARYKDTMSLFSYLASDDLKKLICSCEVVIAKAGGNMSSELVSKTGCKIFFASIKGQETDNAEHYAILGVATNVGNDIDELLKAITDKPQTPSIYKKGILKKSAVDTVVDTILPYL